MDGMIITCRKCGQVTDGRKGQKNICTPCHKAYHAKYYAENKERLRAYEAVRYEKRRGDPTWVSSERGRSREYWRQLRHDAIMAYGGYRCACCGETERAFLSIDHVFNDGAKHRRDLGYKGNGKGGGSRTMKWLKDHGYPAGFQVLCMNCNHGKARNGGICPHKTSQANRVNSGEAQTG